MMRVEWEHIHERLDRVEEGTQRGQPPFAPNAPRRNRFHQREIDEVGEFEATISRRSLIGCLWAAIGDMAGIEKIGTGRITTWEVLR